MTVSRPSWSTFVDDDKWKLLPPAADNTSSVVRLYTRLAIDPKRGPVDPEFAICWADDHEVMPRSPNRLLDAIRAFGTSLCNRIFSHDTLSSSLPPPPPMSCVAFFTTCDGDDDTYNIDDETVDELIRSGRNVVTERDTLAKMPSSDDTMTNLANLNQFGNDLRLAGLKFVIKVKYDVINDVFVVANGQPKCFGPNNRIEPTLTSCPPYRPTSLAVRQLVIVRQFAVGDKRKPVVAGI